MPNEYELHKRRIVSVLDWFDEEYDLPWNYVQRTGDGRFEGIVTHLFDGLHSEEDNVAKHFSVGVFNSIDAAEEAVREHCRRVRAADPLFDYTKPTVQ